MILVQFGTTATTPPTAPSGSVLKLCSYCPAADTVSAGGQYIFRLHTDPLGAVGGISPVVPDWTAVVIPMGARETTPGNTYGHRVITDVVSSALGVANGVNADWPNGAQVTFFGFYRYI